MQTNAVYSPPIDMVMPALPQNIAIAVLSVVIICMVIHGLVLKSRTGDGRLLILLACGAAASLLEGFACHLINCWHSAVGEVEVYEAYGIHVPLWLAQLYVIFFGGMSYYFIKSFIKSPSPLLFWGFFVIVGLLEGTGEMVGIALGMFVYFGEQPLPIFGFPMYLGFLNPSQALVFTCVACLWFKYVKGPFRLLLILFTPILLAGVYAALTFPIAGFLYRGNDGMAVMGSIITMLLSVSLAALAYRVMLGLRSNNELGV
jgi:hypothetical protein